MNDWRHDAACLEEDPELFFPIGTTGHAVLQIEEATAVCRRCPVVQTCLRWALDTGQEAGVWGGMAEDERRAFKRRNARVRRAAELAPAKEADPSQLIIDATPTRLRLERALQLGWNFGAISRITGLSYDSVQKVATGYRTEIRRATADLIASTAQLDQARRRRTVRA